MQLLDKKQITADKLVERKLQIEEGARLARRIDVLRETELKEQANLGKFRVETLKILQEEMKGYEERKKGLLQEISSLEQKLELMKQKND